MATVTKQEVKPAHSATLFVGRAWKNVVKKEGENKGKEFIRIQLDREVAELTLLQADSVFLWPNNQRDGKNDADYRLSIVPAAA